MRFYRDLVNAEPVLRDVRVYDASDTGLIAGQAVKTAAANATEGNGGVIDASATACVDILGVLAEAPSALSVLATGTEKFGKVIINPFATYLAEVDATNKGTETAGSTTGETVTCTFSANNAGGWIYVNGPDGNSGQGNILAIGTATSTTDVRNVTGAAYDDELGATTTASTFVMLPPTFQGGVSGGSIDLDSTFSKIDGKPAPTGADVIALDWFVNSKRFPMERLVIARHAGKKDATAKFYGELFFADHFLKGASTTA